MHKGNYNNNGVKGTLYIASTNTEWREERAHSIGASAVGTLIGENPFSTPLELAQKMREELNGTFDYTQTMPMRVGHAMEGGVAALFMEATGHQIILSSEKETIMRRDGYPFIHASLDRTYWIDSNGLKSGKNAAGNKGVLECKTTRRPIDADNLPLSWIFQLQTQLGISGLREGYIAWFILPTSTFGYKRFDFDEEIFSAAVEVCREFWTKCILGGEDPAPVNAQDVIRLYPCSINGKTITSNSDIKELIAEIKSSQEVYDELKEHLDELKDKLKATFTDEEAIVDTDGSVLVTYKSTAGRKTVDSKKLKEEYEDAYNACLKESEGSRTLKIK